MKTTIILSLLAVFIGTNAKADFQLSKNQRAVVCYGEDDQTLNLSAKRTSLKFTVEGESLGVKKITEVKTDNQTFISYSTSELTLTLSDNGDTVQFNSEQDSQELSCN
jgi:hypothetical protein